ncbi:hypothetical protein [Lacipirellula parvula]|uniref:Uncharacterized protein n=1 Tax=Lacipirellula parvula TaxID=2650471 RepID=A0A5K7XD07_9BACT|nr:hypothetical protein [Lacipirellula parvula]BBO34348.1 hypothetical protein PLANPX_3960 [Lacipirellula parvula]
MTDVDMAIREYLRAPDDGFWEWREGGEAIVWKDNRTIAFRAEVAQVLRWLAPQGLPSFSAILLLLAATRHSWLEDRSGLGIIAGALQESAPQSLLSNAFSELDKVAQLEPELRTQIAAKRVLVEMALEGAPRVVQGSTAEAIAEAMDRGIGEFIDVAEVAVVASNYAPALLARDLHLLSAGIHRVDAQALRMRLTTGIEEAPQSVELELSPSETARQLICSLLNDAEFAGVGRIAKRLESMTSLPRRLSAAPEQEAGGYSDIANRGPLDRLLASELAHDNNTLAVRVAMNEALYICRESPPSLPQTNRAILIDAGIRMWGLPRLFATAAALAFAAQSGRAGKVDFFRASDDFAEPIELLSRSGITEHLAALEPDLHPAAALADFLKRISSDNVRTEPILLTSQQSLDAADVQETLRQLAPPQLLMAAVDRDGTFRLWERTPRGCKLLREATIDLADIVSAPAALVDRSSTSDLPAIFAVAPFPLKLPHAVRQSEIWWSGHWGALSLTSDGRLMRWTMPARGAMQIAERLPIGRLWWASQPDAGDNVFVVAGSAHKLHVFSVGREGLRQQPTPLQLGDFGAVASVCAHNGILFACRKNKVAVFDPATGAQLDRLAIPHGLRWQHGRFFRLTYDGKPWHALSYNGMSARFEAVPVFANSSVTLKLSTMFEYAGGDGPVGVTPTGQFYLTANEKLERVWHDLSGDIRVLDISLDGKRICLAAPHPEQPSRLEYRSIGMPFGINHRCTETAFDERITRNCRALTLRHRFNVIGIDSSGDLALRSAKEQLVSFQLALNTPAMVSRSHGLKLQRPIAFKPVEGYFGYQLSVARWPNGNACFLDSRGLLHLVPANRSLPELTLVLHEGELTGWRSDGQMWGKPYFIAGSEKAGDERSAATSRNLFEPTIRSFVHSVHA